MVLALGLGALNLVYLAFAVAGTIVVIRSRQSSVLMRFSESSVVVAKGFGVLILFIAVRSLFLGSLENPEPRYTLECYPAVIVLATAWWKR
jgi:hypothetical protein